MRFHFRHLCAIAALLTAATISDAHAADTVRLGVASVATNFAPFFVAQELGYYKANDLDVEITVYRGGGPVQEAIAAGAADIGTLAPMTVALATEKGIKEKVVAVADPVTPAGFHMIANKKSGIKNIADLNGKKIGVTATGSSTDFLALWVAKHANIKVQTIPLGGNGLLPAIKSNQVDAIVLFPSVSYRALADQDLIGIFDFGKDMEPVLIDSIVATDDFTAKHPQVLRQFLKAVMKAVDYMKKNEGYSTAFLAKYLGEKDPEIVKRSYRDILLPTPSDGMIKPEWIRSSLGVLELVGMKAPPVEVVFTDKFIPVKQ